MKSRTPLAAVAVVVAAFAVACVPNPPPPTPTTTTTSTTTTTAPDPWLGAEGTCFRFAGIFSYKYIGPKNTYGNAPLYLNATCSGPLEGLPFGTNTFVEASSDSEASAICNAIKPATDTTVYFAARPSVTPAFPASNMYSCVV